MDEVTFQHRDAIELHPQALNILFWHRRELSRKFRDVLGLHYIDHISIGHVDSNNKIIVFSSTPSIFYNLVASGLWEYDFSFSKILLKNNDFLLWDSLYDPQHYNEMKKMKETDYQFKTGFFITNRYDDHQLIFSFASKSKETSGQEYFKSHCDDIGKIGDYCYLSLRKLFDKYKLYNVSTNTHPLTIKNALKNKTQKKHLRLIINNPEVKK